MFNLKDVWNKLFGTKPKPNQKDVLKNNIKITDNVDGYEDYMKKKCNIDTNTKRYVLVQDYDGLTVAFQLCKYLQAKKVNLPIIPINVSDINTERYSKKTGIVVKKFEDYNEDGIFVYKLADSSIPQFENCVVIAYNCDVSPIKIVDTNQIINNNQILFVRSNNSIYNFRFKKRSRVRVKNIYEYNENDILIRLQNGKMNCYDIAMMLDKVEEIATSSMGSMMGLKITPEIKGAILKQKYIINSMTHKEKIDYSLLKVQSRKDRIAKHTKIPTEFIDKLIQLLDILKEKSASIVKNANNPMEIMKMVSELKNFIGK